MCERGAEVQGSETFFNLQVEMCARPKYEHARPWLSPRVHCWTCYPRRKGGVVGEPGDKLE